MSVLLNYLTQADFGGASADAIAEPVSLEQVLAHLRVDSDAGDSAFIESVIIPSARQLAEERSGSAIKPARYRQILSSFPRSARGGFSHAPFSRASKNLPIQFSRGLIESVESVSYIDASGVNRPLDVSKLSIVKSDQANAELSLAAGNEWPQAADVANAVTITYLAGMLPEKFASQFPSVIHWILLACGWAYENREMFLTGKSAAIEIPADYADSLLKPITISTRF